MIERLLDGFLDFAQHLKIPITFVVQPEQPPDFFYRSRFFWRSMGNTSKLVSALGIEGKVNVRRDRAYTASLSNLADFS